MIAFLGQNFKIELCHKKKMENSIPYNIPKFLKAKIISEYLNQEIKYPFQ